MEELRHQLLAGAALPPDENVDAPRGHPLDHVEHLAHGRGGGDDPLAGDLVRQPAFQSLVLLRQPLALGLQPLDLPGAVQRHPGEGGDRVEETPVVGGEGGVGVAPHLLVEDRHIAEVDPAVGEGSGEELAIGPAGELALGPGEEAPLGQQLAPEGGGEEGSAGRRRFEPPHRRHPARPAIGIAGDRHRRRRIEHGADPLQKLVDQLLLGPLPVEGEGEIVERLELEDPPLFGDVRPRVRHGPSVPPSLSLPLGMQRLRCSSSYLLPGTARSCRELCLSFRERPLPLEVVPEICEELPQVLRDLDHIGL